MDNSVALSARVPGHRNAPARLHARSPRARTLDQVDVWIESPTLVLLAEAAEHWSTLRSLLAAGRIVGTRVHDARIVALCRQNGVRELWSADRGFSRFGGLSVVNPLVAT